MADVMRSAGLNPQVEVVIGEKAAHPREQPRMDIIVEGLLPGRTTAIDLSVTAPDIAGRHSRWHPEGEPLKEEELQAQQSERKRLRSEPEGQSNLPSMSDQRQAAYDLLIAPSLQKKRDTKARHYAEALSTNSNIQSDSDAMSNTFVPAILSPAGATIGATEKIIKALAEARYHHELNAAQCSFEEPNKSLIMAGINSKISVLLIRHLKYFFNT
jgi:hypothetical protein